MPGKLNVGGHVILTVWSWSTTSVTFHSFIKQLLICTIVEKQKFKINTDDQIPPPHGPSNGTIQFHIRKYNPTQQEQRDGIIPIKCLFPIHGFIPYYFRHENQPLHLYCRSKGFKKPARLGYTKDLKCTNLLIFYNISSYLFFDKRGHKCW
jgi:hypothetical protein